DGEDADLRNRPRPRVLRQARRGQDWRRAGHERLSFLAFGGRDRPERPLPHAAREGSTKRLVAHEEALDGQQRRDCFALAIFYLSCVLDCSASILAIFSTRREWRPPLSKGVSSQMRIICII